MHIGNIGDWARDRVTDDREPDGDSSSDNPSAYARDIATHYGGGDENNDDFPDDQDDNLYDDDDADDSFDDQEYDDFDEPDDDE